MKKILAVMLVIFMINISALPVFADMPSSTTTESQIPFLATIDDSFDGGILIVCIKKEFSIPNRIWSPSDFGVDEAISSYVDLTATSDNTVIASYSNNPNFRQILQIHLRNSSKQNSISIAQKFMESPYCYSVSVNHRYGFTDEEYNSVQSAWASVTATEFENNNRFITGDPYIDCQYSVFTTQTNKAWAITKGSSSVVVGVIDSGIDPIPDLVDNLVPGYDMNSEHFADPLPNAETGTEPYYDADEEVKHGTRVASLIAASQNNIGISGIAPNIKVMPLRIREQGADDSNAIATVRALVMAQQLGLKIVNLSVNSDNPYDTYTVRDMGNQDMPPISIPLGWLPAMQNFTGLIVNSAGNDSAGYWAEGPVDLNEYDVYPGKFKDNGLENLLVVGSVDEDNEWCVSNWGSGYVDLMAPGRLILTAYADVTRDETTNEIISMTPKYSYVDGSSYSAPMVAATAAMLLSINDTWSPQHLKYFINSNVTYASDLSNRCSTSGVLNVYKTLSLASGATLSNYCFTISASGDDVYYADNLLVEYPSSRVVITDVYANPIVQNNSYQEIIVDAENGTIDISFGSTEYCVDDGEVIYELWFSEIKNTTDPIIAQGNFMCENIVDYPTACGSFMLGDINSDGRVNSSDLSWFDFLSGSYSAAADVNRDHILDNNDRDLLEQYINGDINSLF